MLAQNFLDHTVLGISAEERQALVKVLGMLERGELKYDRDMDADMPNGFNMADFVESGKCGTVACICGWADLLCKTQLQITFFENEGLTELFIPSNFEYRITRDEITPAQAAIALRNYLTLGEPRWSEALS